MGDATQYTVNNQMVNATLMNIADNPTNVQLPGEGGRAGAEGCATVCCVKQAELRRSFTTPLTEY